MLKKKSYNLNETYDEKENLVVGIRYGGNGIIPCHKNCDESCISSSGDGICGGYRGHEKVTVKGTELFIVRCCEDVKCG